MVKVPPQQLAFPSLAFPKERSVLVVDEIAQRWECTDRHVSDLLEEGKLFGFDIAGRQDYVRVPMDAIIQIASRLGIPTATLLDEIRAARPKIISGRARWRVPVIEGYEAFMKENHALALGGK